MLRHDASFFMRPHDASMRVRVEGKDVTSELKRSLRDMWKHTTACRPAEKAPQTSSCGMHVHVSDPRPHVRDENFSSLVQFEVLRLYAQEHAAGKEWARFKMMKRFDFIAGTDIPVELAIAAIKHWKPNWSRQRPINIRGKKWRGKVFDPTKEGPRVEFRIHTDVHLHAPRASAMDSIVIKHMQRCVDIFHEACANAHRRMHQQYGAATPRPWKRPSFCRRVDEQTRGLKRQQARWKRLVKQPPTLEQIPALLALAKETNSRRPGSMVPRLRRQLMAHPIFSRCDEATLKAAIDAPQSGKARARLMREASLHYRKQCNQFLASSPPFFNDILDIQPSGCTRQER